MNPAPLVPTITFRLNEKMLERVDKQLHREDPDVPQSRSQIARLALSAWLRSVESQEADTK